MKNIFWPFRPTHSSLVGLFLVLGFFTVLEFVARYIFS